MSTAEFKDKVVTNIAPHYMDKSDGLKYTPEELAERSQTYRNLLQTFATFLEELELPKRYTLKTGLLWDSQDATDGFHEGTDQCRQVITQTVKELKGQDNG